MKKINLFIIFQLSFFLFLFSATDTQAGNLTYWSSECDIITYKNGEELEVKITEISDNTIKYKKCSYLDGPVYSVNKSELFMIKYANGTKEIVKLNSESEDSTYSNSTNNSTKFPKRKYRKNRKNTIGLGALYTPFLEGYNVPTFNAGYDRSISSHSSAGFNFRFIQQYTEFTDSGTNYSYSQFDLFKLSSLGLSYKYHFKAVSLVTKGFYIGANFNFALVNGYFIAYESSFEPNNVFKIEDEERYHNGSFAVGSSINLGYRLFFLKNRLFLEPTITGSGFFVEITGEKTLTAKDRNFTLTSSFPIEASFFKPIFDFGLKAGVAF